MALIRLLGVVLIGCTAMYLSIGFYARARRKEKLAEQWRGDLRVGDRDGWMREEMAKFDKKLRVRLILLVYVVPIVFVGLLFYWQNYA